MIKKVATESENYTPKEMQLIIRAQNAAINELIDKVNACTDKLKEIGGEGIKEFIKTIDPNA